MNAERLKQIEEMYHTALRIPKAGREAFFKESCGADADLRREVESLLSFEKFDDDFIDSPPESLAAEMFAERENRTNLSSRKIGHYNVKQLLGKGGWAKFTLPKTPNSTDRSR